MAKNIEITLDFLVNIKNDKAKLDLLVKEVESVLRAVNPKLNFSSEDVRKGILILANDTEKAKSSAKDLQKELGALHINVDSSEIESELKKVETKLKELDKISLDPLQQGFEKAGKSSKSFGDKLATFGLAANGIQQLTGTLDQFRQPFEELDKQVQNIGTLGVTNFKQFSDEATKLSVSVPDSAGTIAAGVYDAISAGTIKVKDGVANVAEGMKFVEVASKLGAAGLTTTGDAVNGLTSVMNAYGLEAGEAAKIGDLFFGAVNVGKTTIPELNSSLAAVIPTAAAFGVGFDQVSGAIATMTKQGVPTATATTQIRGALVELAKPGAQLKPILDAAGVSLESLKKDGLQASLKKVGDELARTGVSATQVFGSVEAASAVMLLSGKNAQLAADDLKAVQGSIGSTDAAFAVASQGIEFKSKLMMNKLQAGFNEVMFAVGDVGQMALSTASQFAPLVTSMTGLGSLLPTDKIKSLGTSLLSTLIPSFGATAVSADVATASVGATGASVSALLLPITAVVAGLAGLYLFFTKTEKGKEIAEKIGNAFSELWKNLAPVFDAIVVTGGQMFDAFVEIGKALFEWFIAPFEIAGTVISEVIGWLSGLFGTTSSGKDIFKQLAGVIKDLGTWFSKLGENAKNVAEFIKYTKTIVMNFIREAPELFGVLFDYAKYYLNPANWISGDTSLENKLKSRLDAVIKKITEVKPKVEVKTELDKKSANDLAKGTQDSIDLAKKLNEENTKGSKNTDSKKAKESLLEIAKKEYEIVKAKNSAELQQFELLQNESILREGRKRDTADDLILEAKKLEIANQQKQAFLDIYKAKGLVKSVQDDGKLVFSAKVKSEADKTSLQSTFTELSSKIVDESSKLETIKLKVKVESEEIAKRSAEIDKQKIDWEVSVGLRLADNSSIIEATKTKILDIQTQLDANESAKIKLKTEIANTSDETTKLALQSKLNEVSKSNNELKKQAFDLSKELYDIEDKQYKARLDLLKKSNDKKQEELDKNAQKEAEMLQGFNDKYIEANKTSLEKSKNSTLDNIKSEADAKIKELEIQRDKEIISKEVFEQKKAEIEENARNKSADAENEARKKQQILDNAKAGLELELNRKKEADKLELQKQSIEQEKQLLESRSTGKDESGNPVFASEKDKESYDNLNKQLSDVEALLQEKGTTLGVLTTGLKTTVTDAMTNLFAGNPEAVANSFRGFFAQVAAMLKAQASAFALGLILSPGNVKYLSALPFPLNILAVPTITAATNLAVNTLADPIINSLLSFSTGGRIEQPTMAVIGDGARLGGANREWIFTDEQLKATVQMASASVNGLILDRLANLENAFSNFSLSTTVAGSDLLLVLGRQSYSNNLRAR